MKTKRNKSGRFASESQDNDTKQSIWNKNTTIIAEAKGEHTEALSSEDTEEEEAHIKSFYRNAPKLKIYHPNELWSHMGSTIASALEKRRR
jgi:hypothetical protein